MTLPLHSEKTLPLRDTTPYEKTTEKYRCTPIPRTKRLEKSLPIPLTYLFGIREKSRCTPKG